THEQRPHGERDPIARIRRGLLLPERLRDDAEHRAAVEAQEPVEERDELEIAHRIARHSVGTMVGAAEAAPCTLLELDENAVRARRMNEGVERALGAGAGLLVDQSHASLAN